MSGPGIKQHGESKNLDLEDLATLPAKAALGQIGYSVPASRPVVNTSTNVNSPNFKALAYLEDVVAPVDGVDGLSLLSGTGNPTAGQGKNGDKYLNFTSLDLFEKINGAWELKGNIKGTASSAGTNATVEFSWGMLGVQSGTTTITSKDSAPLVTEGTELWRRTHTAKANGNRLIVEFSCVADCSRRNGKIFFVLFRDNVVVDFGAYTSGNGSGGSPGSFNFRHIATLTDTNPHTYTMRVGTEAATSWYIGRGMDKTMGNINEAYWSIREEKV